MDRSATSAPAMANASYPNGETQMSNQTQPSSKSMSKSKGGWKSAIFIIFVEMAERFAYYGVSGNLINYLINVLGKPTATAAKEVNIWRGVSAIFPLFGAFIADSYLGRFTTVLLSSIVYLAGLVLLTISVASLRHYPVVFFAALYILAIGEGGHMPCVQTFAADQFDEDLPEEKEAKSSFFNWWYLGIVFGATSAMLVVIYVQDNVGWAVGFGMMAAAVAAALALFLIGAGSYRQQAAVGSPFTRMAQVVVAAARKWRISGTSSESCGGVCYEDITSSGGGGGGGDSGGGPLSHVTLAPTNQLRFLDKATMIDKIDASSQTRNPWRLCSVNQVEEAKLLFRLLPIWLTCLMFAVVISQLNTYFPKQGSTMQRTLGRSFQIPPPSIQVFTGVAIFATILIYERVLVPAARKITGHPAGITMLQRIGVGNFLSAITMAVAAFVESRRVRIARDNGLTNDPKSTVPMSLFWLLPQYILCGVSDVFAIVGLQELFYDQMPEQMRSVGAAGYISVIGVGSFLSSAVISAVQRISARLGNEWLGGDNLNKAHLDRFYWVLFGLSAANLCAYVLVARSFVYKKTTEAAKRVGGGGA